MGLIRRTAIALLLAVSSGLSATLPASAGNPITNVEPPVVAGDAVFGALLFAEPGTWTPDGLTITYAWLRDGTPIAGETQRRHRAGLDDLGHTLAVVVTASDGAGNEASVTTASTPVVRRARFETLGLPQLSGVARYTRPLEVSPGKWSAKPTQVRIRWLRDGVPIAGANRATYVLQAADVGTRVSARIRVSRDGYRRGEAVSSAVRVRHRVPVKRTVTYNVETRGRITANLGTFRRQVLETYRAARGWRSAGIVFRPVSSRGTFTVVLSQASWVPRFSSACSPQWSCRVGRYVIINQTRWLRASPSWNEHGLALRDYRHMVLNHETGHWLGHGHLGCPGAGQLAPVMMQQSKGLDGCRHNPWPKASELWTR